MVSSAFGSIDVRKVSRWYRTRFFARCRCLEPAGDGVSGASELSSSSESIANSLFVISTAKATMSSKNCVRGYVWPERCGARSRWETTLARPPLGVGTVIGCDCRFSPRDRVAVDEDGRGAELAGAARRVRVAGLGTGGRPRTMVCGRDASFGSINGRINRS